MSPPVDLSIVIPVYNEEPNLRLLHAELRDVLAGLPHRAEIIVVDDASEDRSAAVVRELAASDVRVRLVHLRSHAGLTAAFAAGFRAASGAVVVTLDGDLQNDPRDIPAMLAALEHVDLVQGCRVDRHDPWSRRLASRIGNGVRNRVLGEHVRDAACSLRAIRRSCLDQLALFDGGHRFLPSLFRMRGWRVREIPVHHRTRRYGVAKFGVRNRAGVALADLLAVRWLAARQLVYDCVTDEPVVRATPHVAPAAPSPSPAPSAHPALALAALWTIVAALVVAWGVLAAPPAGHHLAGRAGGVALLDDRPAERLLTVWVRWDAPRGSTAWIVLEPDRPWQPATTLYWRRHIHPGWNQLVWDDFSGFPEHAGVRLRMLDGDGPWAVTPPTVSSRYTVAHLAPLRGLVLALALAAAAAVMLAWRGSWRTAASTPSWWPPALAITAAVALALRLHTLATQSFWFDEVLTAIGSQSFAWVLYSRQIFGHPPLQYVVAWAAGAVDATEVAVRAPFVAAGVGAVIAVAYLGRRLLGAPTGLLAAAMLAISPFHVELSQLARPYAFLILGVALLLLTLFRALERGATADWLAFSAIAALALYTHYLAALVLAIDAVVAATWIARRRGDGALRALLSFAGIAILLAPWAHVLTRVAATQIGGGTVSPIALGDLVTTAVLPQLIGSGVSQAVTASLIVLGVWRMRSRPEVVIAMVSSVAVPIVAVLTTHPTHFLAGRHLAFVLPVLALVVAHGLVTTAQAAGAALTAAFGRHRTGMRRAATALAALALMLVSNASASPRLSGYYSWRQGGDWRTVAAVLDELVKPGDDVVATLGAVYPLRYYWNPSVTEVDARSLRDRYENVGAGRRLWIVTLDGWDWAPELHQWLDAHTDAVRELPPSWSIPRVRISRAIGARR